MKCLWPFRAHRWVEVNRKQEDVHQAMRMEMMAPGLVPPQVFMGIPQISERCGRCAKERTRFAREEEV